SRWGEPVNAFHEKNEQRLSRWPESMLATSSHDTKRGEDVRTRINVLSEVPTVWAGQIRRWRILARRSKQLVDGHLAPDKNDEYLLYQTLCGAWPTEETPESMEQFSARIAQYLEKAIKEAKRHTSWINPNPAYDAAVRKFVEELLARDSAFLAEF